MLHTLTDKVFRRLHTLGVAAVLLLAPAALPARALPTDSLPTDSLAADTFAADSAQAWPLNVQARLAALTDDALFSTTQLGLCVWDLTDDSLLFAHGHRQTLRPASCEKLFTAVAALWQLGDSYCFRTRLYRTGEVSDSTLHGDLYVVGGFDPAFSGDDMRAFALSLTEAGIFRIEGNIYADLSLKDTLQWGSGWCWDDGLERLTPLLYKKKDVFMPRFFRTLEQEGVSCNRNYALQRLPQATAVLMAERSHTMEQILLPMMKESDNMYAEAMFYQLSAAGSRPYAGHKEAAARVEAMIGRAGGEVRRIRVADGSGLSLYNYTTAETLVKVLRFAWREQGIYAALQPALPVAGEDGTLKSRMQRSTARGNVQAKTGTVTGVSTLAGYATAANGHTLCFAILNQGGLNKQPAQRFQDTVCEALTSP